MEKTTVRTIDLNQFKALFGCHTAESGSILEDVLKTYKGYDFSYRLASSQEEREIILEILKKISSQDSVPSGRHRYEDWENGWQENLELFVKSGFETSVLTPKYYRDGQAARLKNNFIFPFRNDFIFTYFDVFRKWILYTYLSPFDHVYEFGCGTAINLLALAEKYSHKEYFGFDWSLSSVKIIDHLRDRLGLNINGGRIDFFKPMPPIGLKKNAGVFTFSALEQIGEKTEYFINLMITEKPNLVVNIEPVNEFYDKDNLLDYLALTYHTKRNYLHNYYTRLRELEHQGAIKILFNFHHQVGNIYNTTASYIIWKPL